MKKFTGNYTADAGKILKGSDRLVCVVAADDEIYISNGYVLYKLARYEYAATIQPVTCCEPGNWIMDKNGERTEDNAHDLPRLFADTVKSASQGGPLTPCPLSVRLDNKTTAAAYYSPVSDFAAIYNAKFISALAPCAVLHSAGPISGAVAYNNDEPFAIVLPIKPTPETTRAVRAYFTEQQPAPKNTEADKLRDQIAQLRAELQQAQHEIECQAAALAAAAEHKTEQQPAPKTAAEQIAAQFTGLDGVTVTIKGAQTSAPVVWITGDTERHADKIESSGGKWSNKKSAYYVRVA